MADVAAAMREGLLAFSTAAGLVVMQQMLTAELTGIVGPKHAKLGPDRVAVSGDGAEVETDVDAARRSVSALVQCALRHGGLDEVSVVADGATIHVSPITPASAPVVLGEDLRDLGAAVAVTHVRALGGSVAVDGEALTIRFP